MPVILGGEGVQKSGNGLNPSRVTAVLAPVCVNWSMVRLQMGAGDPAVVMYTAYRLQC